jgi:hypothetical protein
MMQLNFKTDDVLKEPQMKWHRFHAPTTTTKIKHLTEYMSTLKILYLLTYKQNKIT